MTASAEQITATIDRYVEVFSTGDKDGYLGAVRRRTRRSRIPSAARSASGPVEIAGFWDGVRGLTPTITLQLVGAPRVAAGEAGVRHAGHCPSWATPRWSSTSSTS